MRLGLSSSLFALQRASIAGLAIPYRLATMFTSKNYVYAGGLFSYGPDITAMFRRSPMKAVLVLVITWTILVPEVVTAQAAPFSIR